MRLETFASIKLPNMSARIMRAALEAADLDWRPVLKRANLTTEMLDDPKGVITGAQELLLQTAFVEATRHLDGVWYRLGLEYRLMSFGPLGLTVLAAGTFAQGLRSIFSYRALTYSLMEYRLVEEDGELVAVEADDSHVAEDCREFCQERGLGAATRILNDMHPGLEPILRLETVLDDGHGRRDCSVALGAPVVFNAPVTRLVLRPGVGQAPLPMANPLLEQTYAELCTQLIEEAQVSDAFVTGLYNLLVRAGRDYPNAPDSARLLGVSERSLYRRLAAQGLTFGEVLERVRRQRAAYLLDHTGLSIEQIGDALGFAETASFSRAFKRWFGVAPLGYRKRGLSRSGFGQDGRSVAE